MRFPSQLESGTRGLRTEERRRLAAIMFTDVAGYTALTQQNEQRTLALLKKQRQALRQIFGEHGGAEIKTGGDSFLVEFASALDAVKCAVRIQRALRDTSAERPGEVLPLRIGVHLGDVVHTENDVFGDAVNIASRIESVADSGGICVSQQVYDQVWNKVEGCGFEKLEGRQLKNVSAPVGIYRISIQTDERAYQPQPLQSRRVAVLPLANFSPDSADLYIADAMTDELINSLSRIRSLRVIARTSVMTYKNTTKSISEIAETLRVGSILQGSILKSGKRVRITLQLVDSKTEEQLWDSKYDREMDDIFAIQDDIARNVTESLKVRLGQAETKPPEDIDAYTHYLRGKTLLYERTEKAMQAALKHFDDAIRKDPSYARAYAGKADALYLLGYYFSLPFDEGCREARKLAQQALELDSNLAEAHATLGVILCNYDYDYKKSEEEFKQALALNPSYAQAHHWNALMLAIVGRIEEGVEEMKRAHDADPLSPQISVFRGVTLSWAGRDEDALEIWRSVQETNPDFHILYFQRAMHHIERGEKDLALADARRKARLTPDDVASTFLQGYADARFGETEKTMKTIRDLTSGSKGKIVPPELIAHLYAALGDNDRFFQWADRAIDEHQFGIPEVRYGRIYTGVRADPRYSKLLRDLGIPAKS